MPNKRTIDTNRVKYKSSSKEIKLYSDPSSNGIKRNTAVNAKNVRITHGYGLV